MDQDLVSRAAAGDHDAFTILIDAEVDRAFTLARLIVRDDELARDVVQDTLVQVWPSLPGPFSPRSHASTAPRGPSAP
jgi:RNA polymerase sigma-70 factor, ECF subfamily